MEATKLVISVVWPNGDSFNSTTVYPDPLDCMGNQPLMDAIQTLMESAIQSGMMVGPAKGMPVVEEL